MDSEPQLTGSVTIRALSLLEAFLPGRELLQISEMARSAGLPISTAHRLAQDLLAWGALERTQEGLYVVGSRLRQVASMAPRKNLNQATYLPILEDLVSASGYSALLAVLEDDAITFIEHVTSQKNAFRPRAIKNLALTTAAGRTLIAFSNPRIQQSHLDRGIQAITRSTVTDPETIRRELVEIRRRGFAVTDRQAAEETIGIAVPVWTNDNASPVAALSLVLPSSAPEFESAISLCQSAAHRIRRSIDTATAI